MSDPYAPGGHLHWIAQSRRRSSFRTPPLPQKTPAAPKLDGLSVAAAARAAGVYFYEIVRACDAGELAHEVHQRGGRRFIRISGGELERWKVSPKPITIAEAAKLVGASQRTIRLWIARGLPTSNRAGKTTVYPTAFAEWVQENRPNFGKTRDHFASIIKTSDPEKGGKVYGLCDPRPEYKGRPIRYIGQTADLARRMKCYRHDFKNGRAHSRALRNWFGKLQSLGLMFSLVELGSRDRAIGELEQEWIARGRQSQWALLNTTEGGDETPMSLERRRRLSEKSKAAWSRPEYRERWSKSMSGHYGKPVVLHK